jgi:hypothetical protein
VHFVPYALVQLEVRLLPRLIELLQAEFPQVAPTIERAENHLYRPLTVTEARLDPYCTNWGMARQEDVSVQVPEEAGRIYQAEWRVEIDLSSDDDVGRFAVPTFLPFHKKLKN